jgi:hypothetical protein
MRRQLRPPAPLLLFGLADKPDSRALAKMSCFDNLPPRVRAALAQSPCDFNPIQIGSFYRSVHGGETATLNKIANSERNQSTGNNTVHPDDKPPPPPRLSPREWLLQNPGC